MGTVYKKRVTRPLPANASVETKRRRATAKELRRNPEQTTVAEQVATWRDRTGKKRTAVVVVRADGSQRIRVESATYYCQFRDGDDLQQEKPTGCRDRTAAEAKLAELLRVADKVRVGSLTTLDLELGQHSKTPVRQHVVDYVEYLRQEQKHPDRIKTTETRLNQVSTECKFESLRDLNADAFTSWLAQQQGVGRSPAVLNGFVECVVAFGYWLTGKRTRGRKSNLLGEKRLHQNPFAGIGRFDVKSDRRRNRRALSEAELRRLLFVARWRPLAEFGRESERRNPDELPTDGKSRKTWTLKPLRFEEMPAALDRARLKLASNPAFVVELERRGWERSLVYKLAVLTGLRRGEVESLTVGHLHLDGPLPFVRMQSRDTKNREAVDVPLRGDLVDDLRQWVDSLRNPDGRQVVPMYSPANLPLSVRLFNVPRQLVKNLDRDLVAAGIARRVEVEPGKWKIDKRDERGRTIDVHALRHTFGTLLSTSGVAPRTAQQAMRHSEIGLTMNVYTDPRLLDVAGAVDALPDL